MSKVSHKSKLIELDTRILYTTDWKVLQRTTVNISLHITLLLFNDLFMIIDDSFLLLYIPYVSLLILCDIILELLFQLSIKISVWNIQTGALLQIRFINDFTLSWYQVFFSNIPNFLVASINYTYQIVHCRWIKSNNVHWNYLILRILSSFFYWNMKTFELSPKYLMCSWKHYRILDWTTFNGSIFISHNCFI